jgi:hypothetical protein
MEKTTGREMTDREMLMLAYGALKATDYSSNKRVIEVIEIFLFGPKEIYIPEISIPSKLHAPGDEKTA